MICGFQGRQTKTQVTTRPGNSWPEERSNLTEGSQRNAIHTCTEEEPKLDTARVQRVTYFLPDDDKLIFSKTPEGWNATFGVRGLVFFLPHLLYDFFFFFLKKHVFEPSRAGGTLLAGLFFI